MEKSILVIDDDRTITRTLRNLLTKEGYATRTSDDGYKALDEIFGEEVFDLIICDLRMPGMDGVETVKGIKEYLKARNRPDIPAIFITGYVDSELTVKARDLGRVIFKPFDTNDLLDGIKEYLE